MSPIFVRHGRSSASADEPTHSWPLDPDGHGDIEALALRLPTLPVICSDMQRAIETAAFFGDPIVDARLGEVTRPFVDDLDDALSRYFTGQGVDGWEPQADAVARMDAAVADHREALYVTHGTVLSLLVASHCPSVDALTFWGDLRLPDAWSIHGATAVRIA